MIDLEHEITRWCRSIHTSWWKRNERVEELKDHLYCEIERLQEDGFSMEESFFMATERLGDADELMNEHSKNRNIMSLLFCQIENNMINNPYIRSVFMNSKLSAVLIIVVSLIFAAAIVLSSYLLKGSDYAQYSQTVTFLLIAVWFIPFSLLTAAGTKHKECETT